MEWYHVLATVAGNFAVILPLWLWNRAESRSDHRHLENWVKASIDAIKEEMKDFHGRLCAIEERNKK
jgi:hypothetical protein